MSSVTFKVSDSMQRENGFLSLLSALLAANDNVISQLQAKVWQQRRIVFVQTRNPTGQWRIVHNYQFIPIIH